MRAECYPAPRAMVLMSNRVQYAREAIGHLIEAPEDKPEISIVFPCLNEHDTVADSVREALRVLEENGIYGEVIVADNGSTDGSQEIARAEGARVIEVPEKGYGSALQGGIRAARGDYVLMADCDGSYDVGHL